MHRCRVQAHLGGQLDLATGRRDRFELLNKVVQQNLDRGGGMFFRKPRQPYEFDR